MQIMCRAMVEVAKDTALLRVSESALKRFCKSGRLQPAQSTCQLSFGAGQVANVYLAKTHPKPRVVENFH